MSEHTCPKCGAEPNRVVRPAGATLYTCGTRKITQGSVFYSAGDIIESEACLRSQLMSKNTTISELREWHEDRTQMIADLESKLAEASKAGTPYYRERDTMNALVVRNQQLEAVEKLLTDAYDENLISLVPDEYTSDDGIDTIKRIIAWAEANGYPVDLQKRVLAARTKRRI